MKRIPLWRRARRWLTSRLFDFVYVEDFGGGVEVEDNSVAFSAALSYRTPVGLRLNGTYVIRNQVTMNGVPPTKDLKASDERGVKIGSDFRRHTSL